MAESPSIAEDLKARNAISSAQKTPGLLLEGAVDADFLAGSEEMSRRVSEFDWSTTPLGDRASWPQSLKTVVRVLLTSRFAMWMSWGPQLTFLYNDAYARMTLGKKHPWALGKPSHEVWAEIWDDIGPRIQRVLDTGQATWDEALLLFLERSGYREETYHTFSYSPLSDDDGRVAGHLCVVSEETERIISERRLRTLRELLERTFEQAKHPEQACRAAADTLSRNRYDIPFALIYLLDDAGENARLIEAVGLERDTLPAPAEIKLNEGKAPWNLDETLSSGSIQIVEDLERKFGLLTAGPWEDDSTKEALVMPLAKAGVQDVPAGFLIAGISPRIRLDDKYQDFLQLVAGHVATAVANARALEEERERAEKLTELDRAKTTFFSNISHELRTPLTLILGPTEDALSSDHSLGGSELEMVHRNEVRLLKLVNTLLDFSRIEAGRIQASFEPADVSTFTAELASVFRSAIERAGLQFVIDCQPLHKPIFLDREMWEKIVLNLLSNAFKCTFDGEIRVSVRDEHNGARVIISDTGTGISADELPRLFERFHRIEGARKRTQEGSGIGLALVQELVKMHEGAIHVQSEVGKGTEFEITIPFGVHNIAQGRISPRQDYRSATNKSPYVTEAMSWVSTDSSVSENTPHELGNLVAGENRNSISGRILLADDNRDMRDYVRRLLSGQFEVVTAANGREALEVVLKNPPDLVLSDIMMPGMNGLELLAAIRANISIETIPVILLSARAGEEARVEGLERGADDYLVKPFSARELIARVQTHLELARVRKKAVETLRESEERFRTIVDTTPECVKLVAADGTLLLMNAPGLKLIGADLDRDVAGMNVFDLIAPEHREKFCDFHAEVCKGMKGSLEFDIIGLDGVRRHMETHATPMRIASGSVAHLAVTRDVTDRKRTEEALRRSEKIAAVGRLAATMAHEINNPLESVTNLLYLVKKDSGISERARKQLELADQELDRVAHVARQTLGFYRDNAAPSRFRVSQVIGELVEVYRYKFRNREIELTQEVDPSAEVFASLGEFRQVFSNLLVNAIDALPASHGRIWIRVRRVQEWRSSRRPGARITIADSGYGIAPENRRRIFDSFFTTKQDIGTGLGLWLTRTIVDKHGGSIQVRSRTRTGSSGTVFSVFWPAGVPGLHQKGVA